jgi:hypothetical protein
MVYECIFLILFRSRYDFGRFCSILGDFSIVTLPKHT